MPAATAPPAPAPEPTPPVLRELREVAPLPPLRSAVPLPSVSALVAPLPAPTAPTALAPLPAPVETRILTAPTAPLPVPTQQPLTGVAPVEPINLAAPKAPAMLTPAPAPAAAAAPNAVPGPSPDAGAPPRPAFGNPDAGAALGHDVATPPSAPASAPRLNLDLARPRGGEISRQGSRGMLNVLPHPPERDSKLAEDIQKSARPDCRTAYSGMGLLAAAPLAADAIKKDGCRW
jgi:hypothetical protein